MRPVTNCVFFANIDPWKHFHCRYDKKSECLKKSYNSNHKRQILYRGQVVQLEVDGEFTFDENLCDVEALEMISKKELDNIERQDQLPGVSFTKNQTFFINIAQVKLENFSKIIFKVICIMKYKIGLLRIDWKCQPCSSQSS